MTIDEQEFAIALQIGIRALLNLPLDAKIALIVDAPAKRSADLADVPYICMSEIGAERLNTLISSAAGMKRFAESTTAHAIQLAKGPSRG